MKNLDRIRKQLNPARRKKIKARAAALISEERTLQELRHAHKLTQKRMAEVLGIGQDSVSRLEQRSDLLISTLRGYVEAMGGRLSLIAEFPNQDPVVLAGRGTNLIRGQNVMAVEVHQFNESTTAGHDTYFDMELSVTYPITAIIPDLRITLLTNTAPAIRLNWSTNAPGWVLESATSITGLWSTVTGVTGGAGGPSYQTPISQGGPQRFYRMRNEDVTP